MQDFTQIVMYGRDAAYTEADRSFCLPSEDALWDAPDSRTWYAVLKAPGSPYGDMHERMFGVPWKVAVIKLQDEFAEPIPLNPAAHFILVHYIQSRLGSCVQSRTMTPAMPSAVLRAEIDIVQHMLQKWFDSWKTSPSPPSMEAQSMNNICMTFYWTTKLPISAHRDGVFPIIVDDWIRDATTFLMTMHWMKYIRVALDLSGVYDDPFLADSLWRGLLRIRWEIWNARSMEAVEYLEGISSFLRL